jgi:hypothetical protein
LSAERLATDFLKIKSQYGIPFRTEETLVVVTGDITRAIAPYWVIWYR